MKKILLRFAEEEDEYVDGDIRSVKKIEELFSMYDCPSLWTGISPSEIFDGYILSKCIHCKNLQLLKFQNVSVDDAYERQMGYEIQYSSSIEAICDNCGAEEDSFAELAFYEYPEFETYMDDISLDDFEVDLCCTDYIALSIDNIDLLNNESKNKIKSEILEAQKMKDESEKLKLEIEKLESLVNDPDTQERDFQQFFEINHWMFGVDYKGATPQEQICNQHMPDFLLEKYDGYHDILDLKLPIPELFKKMGNKIHPRHELSEGCSQVEYYISYSTENAKRIEADIKKKIYRPKGILVIGRSNISEKDRLRMFNDDHPKVKIMTYDDVIQKATNMLNMISCFNFDSNIRNKIT
jgi:hypothetical protein